MKSRRFLCVVAIGVLLTTAGCTGNEEPDEAAPSIAESTATTETTEPAESSAPAESDDPELSIPEGQCNPTMAGVVITSSPADTFNEPATGFTPAFITAHFEPICSVTGQLVKFRYDIEDGTVSEELGDTASIAILRGVEPETVAETARTNGLSVASGASEAAFTTEDGKQGVLTWQYLADSHFYDLLPATPGIELELDDLIVIAEVSD